MNSITFSRPPSGTVHAPVSKSMLHRQILASALSDGPVRILCGSGELSQDIEATLRGIVALGAEVRRDNPGILEILPLDRNAGKACTIDCGESGSTLRFLLPVAAAIGREAEFMGQGRLPERPVSELTVLLRSHGISFSAEKLPFLMTGRLKSGLFSLPGNVSSQYVTGLLFALPLLEQGGTVQLTSPLRSADYVRMTLQVLNEFGVRPETHSDGWTFAEKCDFHSPCEIITEGDWSNGAFFLAAGALGGSVSVSGLNPDSRQGDKRILELLKQFGAVIREEKGQITVSRGDLQGIETDMEEIPDLLPVLSVLASAATGTSRFLHCGRTRLKECDRLKASAEMAQALGAVAEISGDTLILTGNGSLKGNFIHTYGDHRMVMAAAAAAVCSDGPVQLEGPEAVRKSYPDFFRDLQQTGGVLS